MFFCEKVNIFLHICEKVDFFKYCFKRYFRLFHKKTEKISTFSQKKSKNIDFLNQKQIKKI